MIAKDYLYQHNEHFNLESGSALPGFQLKYTTLGKLNSEQSNVVWVCHALTGDSSFNNWWGDLFTEEGPFSHREYFIVCANVLGGCYGSTGPLSVNPQTSEPYYHDFPIITNHDIVKAFDFLRVHLGIKQVHTLIGASLGGQQVLTWAIYKPEIFEHIILIACNAKHSPWGIAINEAQRMAIAADSSWESKEPSAGLDGLKAARAMSMPTFRSFEAFESQSDTENQKLERYNAASYQRYQGEKLANRFNAFSYWVLTKTMDNHNVGREFDNIREALNSIQSKALVIGIDSDLLFPVAEQEFIYENIQNAQFEIIQSKYGHDAFLIEINKLKSIIQFFIKSKFVLQNE
ncbi:MAG: homoserine O-acetyltransferase [Cyclobacteriaceae bacterium]|nr:homoserine O-acetyltransferase [Cyclobacteriaceae bacterium]